MIHGWIAVVAPLAVFSVMFSLGLILTGPHIVSTLRRPLVLLAVVFAAVVPLPLLAVAGVEWLGLRGPVAVGILLMAIAPGAPPAPGSQKKRWPCTGRARWTSRSRQAPGVSSRSPRIATGA